MMTGLPMPKFAPNIVTGKAANSEVRPHGLETRRQICTARTVNRTVWVPSSTPITAG